MRIASFFTVLLILNLVSCSKKDNRHILQGKAQGTTFSLIYYSDVEKEIEDGVTNILKDVDRSLSTYDNQSYISKWNKGNEVDTLDRYFLEMYLMSKLVYDQTSGYFDPTVEPLSQFYGFEKKKEVLPNEIDSILQFVGLDKLKLTEKKLLKLHPQLKLNFNAIAQGYTVDLISDYLKSKGIVNFIFELGGEVYCSGLKPDDESWLIAVDKPNKERDGTYQNSVKLSNLSITTSGNYRKWIDNNETGEKYTHTINPINGTSSPSDLLSVTIIHKSCAMADAYSTALLSMKYNRAVKFLKESNLMAMFIIEKNNSPELEYFNGFAHYIKD